MASRLERQTAAAAAAARAARAVVKPAGPATDPPVTAGAAAPAVTRRAPADVAGFAAVGGHVAPPAKRAASLLAAKMGVVGGAEVTLNPAVSRAAQRATWAAAFASAAEQVALGKVPVIVIDHRLSGIDDRPIIEQGLQALGQRHGIAEFQSPAAMARALRDGVLKSLPGYTAEATTHWLDQHRDFFAQRYPGLDTRTLIAGGGRLDINFMGYSVREAKAAAGLAELAAGFAEATQGRGKIVFAGQGTGSEADFVKIYADGGLKKQIADGSVEVRFGAPMSSAGANARAAAYRDQFNARAQGAGVDPGVIVLDHDSAGKAGWVETIERVPGQIVVAFADDRAHNLTAGMAASTLREQMIMIKVAAPGLSFSQIDSNEPSMTSTFHPNP